VTRIKEDRGVEAELVKGAGGVFDVVVDGKLIYSKQQTGRFPDPEEILAKLD
jgi:selenoprotein W-related protein